MSDKRVDGFWWVRICGAWDVVRIAYEGAYFGTLGPLAQSVDEWGPYLGKEPGGAGCPRCVTGHDVDSFICSQCTAQWERSEIDDADSYNPTTDYEGEDTRALDGAGEPKPIDREPKP